MQSEITITDILAEMQRLGISPDHANDKEARSFCEIKEAWNIGAVQTRNILKRLAKAGVLQVKRIYRARIDGSMTPIPGYVLMLAAPQAKSKGVKREGAKKANHSRKALASRAKKATKKRG